MICTQDMLTYETQARQQGLRFIFGVDEAGCGPLAGPVVASAVYLRSFKFKCPINDSKQMTARARENAFQEIFKKANVGIGIISESAIDEINILNAAQHAMEAAVRHLVRCLPESQNSLFNQQVMLFVDGNRYRCQLPYKFQTIVKGDEKSFSIACASIIAKVTRDRIMETYHRLFPQYGFLRHKGYATEFHRQALEKYGPCMIHRKSFQWAPPNGGSVCNDF
jgi:ribonuclease HII